MKCIINLSVVAFCVLVCANVGQAVLVQTEIFSETFDTNTPDLATTVATYPDFSGVSAGGIAVASNRLEINRTGNNYFLTNASFAEETWVTVDMGGFGTTSGNGQYATALVIGNRAFQFFPGCCEGAFRIYNFDPTSGALVSLLSSPTDIDMDFQPASNTFHHVSVHSDNVGGFDVEIIDGNNPLNIYSQSFSFGGFVPGKIGFSALHNGNVSFFDNLSISALREQIVPAPEPNSALLLGAGGMLMLSMVRSKRRKQAQSTTADPLLA